MKHLLGISALALACLSAVPAGAYNNREHQRLPDQAYQILNILKRGEYLTRKVEAITGFSVAPLSQRPASVPQSEQARWDQFITLAKATPDALGRLRTALPNALSEADRCGGHLPELGAGEKLAMCRASELPFAVKRHWHELGGDCSVRMNYFAGDSDAPEFFEELPSNFTGAMLGYYAQMPDDQVRDTVMWIRPSDVLMQGEIKSAAKSASQSGLKYLLVPIFCVFSIFGGDDCWSDAEESSKELDPFTNLDQKAADFEKEIVDQFPYLSGIDGNDADTTGVWHFINVNRTGDFNTIPGLKYTRPGLGAMDGFDYIITTATDLGGLNLDVEESQGIHRYQQSPDGRIDRARSDWMVSIAHVEFEPLDNFALYGWRRFRAGDTAGLGWVLHGLGDVVAPHHLISSTGWGHRPYEDYAGLVWKQMFSEGGASHYFRLQAIVEEAYRWWKHIDDVQTQTNTPNDIDVRELITAIGKETIEDSAFAYKSGISTGYWKNGTDQDALDHYEGSEDSARVLLERGIGSTLAFFVKLAPLVPTVAAPSPCECPPGQALGVPSTAHDGWTCQPCSSASNEQGPLNMVEVDGHCEHACPADKPFLDEQGRCSSSCPGGACTGVFCANPTDFVESGVCVTDCSAANPVIVGRECRATCPLDLRPTVGTNPVFCVADPQCKTNVATRDGDGVCDENCAPGEDFVLDGQCVTACPSNQNHFVADTPPFVCLTACPGAQPLSVPVPDGVECVAECPADLPWNSAEECSASCASDLLYFDGFTCYAECPPAKPWSLPSGQCVVECPPDFPYQVGTKCLATCPGEFCY